MHNNNEHSLLLMFGIFFLQCIYKLMGKKYSFQLPKIFKFHTCMYTAENKNKNAETHVVPAHNDTQWSSEA